MKHTLFTGILFLLLHLPCFAQDYCLPLVCPDPSGQPIYNLALHTLVNFHSHALDTGYKVFPPSAFTTELAIGQSYPITWSKQNTITPYDVAIWIDLDNDGDFEDFEQVLLAHDVLEIAAQVEIPYNLDFVGERRMRVIAGYYLGGACYCPSIAGEIEDYTITILSTPSPPLVSYHIPPAASTVSNKIEFFRFHDLINYRSGLNDNHYTYGSDSLTTQVALGGTYPLLLSFKSYNYAIFGVWIDFDNNGFFEETEQVLATELAYFYTHNTTITIPNNTDFLGWRRMRVRSASGNAENIILPNAYYYFGSETEDYDILIAETDSTPPDFYCIPPIFINTSSKLIKEFSIHTLSRTVENISELGYTNYPPSDYTTEMALGGAYQLYIDVRTWERTKVWIDYNDDGHFSNAEVLFASSTGDDQLVGVTLPTNLDYVGTRRLRVRTADAPNDACAYETYGETEDYTITLLPPETGYCVPYNYDPQAYAIANVQVNTLENFDSGIGEQGYTLYTSDDFSTDLVMGESYAVQIGADISTGLVGNYALWIDLNNDTLFTENERLYSDELVSESIGTITIPTNTTYVGPRRMRVRMYVGGGIPEPCDWHLGTEIEDYEVNIVSNVLASNTPDFTLSNITVYPNPANEQLFIETSNFKSSLRYTLLDILGKTMLPDMPIQSSKVALQIGTLPTGLYYLVIADETSRYVEPIFID